MRLRLPFTMLEHMTMFTIEFEGCACAEVEHLVIEWAWFLFIIRYNGIVKKTFRYFQFLLNAHSYLVFIFLVFNVEFLADEWLSDWVEIEWH